jgi:quinol-cytochrome oxidoreductase complex cytochrome b subunit
MGYVLNWGQMSFRGITVMLNVLSVLPMVGIIMGDYLWCSSLVIVNRIFVVHFMLGLILGCIILVHIGLLHSFGSCNPLMNSNSGCIVSFYGIFFKDVMFSCVIFWCMSFYLF